MKVLLAFDKYKGSLSASEACAIAAEAIKEFNPEIEITHRPLSDGGEGFCEIVTTALGGVFRDYRVTYPDIRTGTARVGYVFLDKLSTELLALMDLPANGLLGVVEMAQAAGHHLVPNAARNPWNYTTAGVGELVRYAKAEGASSILLGVGGSATNDMGIGLLEAFGLKAMDVDGNSISPIIPLEWDAITHFEAPAGIPELNIRIACDVRNPLHGSDGAASVFGPQKGLRTEDIPEMQAQMKRIGSILSATEGLRSTNAESPGMGAAGGLPFGLSLAFPCKLIPGFDLICSILDLKWQIQNSDLVLTGEGTLDVSSLGGKGPYEVVRQCVAASKRIAVLPGKAVLEAQQHLTALHPKVQVLQVGLDGASIEENIRNEAVHLKQRVKTILDSVFN